MREKKPSFKKKWQAVLYDLLLSFHCYRWQTLSIREAWSCADHEYLKRHGIKKYSAFEHHLRRFKQWGYLYTVPNPQKPSKHYPIPDRYLVSKSAINRLERFGVIASKDANRYKNTVGWIADDLDIPVR